MAHLDGKVAIVTGASRGIGAATAQVLAREGARVVLAARSDKAIAAIAQSLSAEGHEAIAYTCDVSDARAVAALMDHTVQVFGRIDVLINNAGLIDPIARIADSDPDAWGRVIDVNLKGIYHGLRYAIPVMVAQGGEPSSISRPAPPIPFWKAGRTTARPRPRRCD